MMNMFIVIIVSFSCILVGFFSISARRTLEEGPGYFTFMHGDKPITVWYFKPINLKKDAEIVFVMHGMKRNGKKYRDSWVKHAEGGRFLLVVPEFSKEYFKGRRAYNLGNLFTKSGKHVDESSWSFSAIELIFDQVKKMGGFKASGYSLYGHSAGAQFVHRFIIFVPISRVKTAVAANAGWYTMPPFPDGLRRSGIPNNQLRTAFSKKLVVLLGTNDNDPNHKYLRKTPEAMSQGRHRLERGETFFEKAKNMANEGNLPFSWELRKVEGVGHSNSKMSKVAAGLITGNS